MILPRSLLHLELTESAIMKNRDVATRVIQRLSREGVSFKLDDFGTGYSSLGYLHAIPIDCVKIDKSFISRLAGDGDSDPSAGVVRGIISLSHELGKTVVAEGIETEEQARMLRDYGCDLAQGYFFGRPMDRSALFASLHAGAPSGAASSAESNAP
jgi:EAL domain-containing protein (putative c-di-GMP-specific phosphodiesterase class I)